MPSLMAELCGELPEENQKAEGRKAEGSQKKRRFRRLLLCGLLPSAFFSPLS